MKFKHIKKIITLNNYELLATFDDGKKKKYDMKPLIEELLLFKPLKTKKGLFKKAHLDIAGYGVIWNDDIDIAAEEIYYNGIDVL